MLIRKVERSYKQRKLYEDEAVSDLNVKFYCNECRESGQIVCECRELH